MRTQYADSCGSLRYAGRILPVFALIVMFGCGGSENADQKKKGVPVIGMPVNSPITVADGSMEVRTKARYSLSGNSMTVSGGQACYITIGPNGPYNVNQLNWTITSADTNAYITVVNLGQQVVANANTSASPLLDGPGAAFAVKFSPPTFKLNNVSQNLTCDNVWPRCKVWIDYEVGGDCPASPPPHTTLP
jgi:hypothetical protein